MLAKSLLVALGMAAVGSAFTLPEGQANGVYRAYYNAAGEEVHELITGKSTNIVANSARAVSNWARAHAKRQNSPPLDTGCVCGPTLNTGDTNSAVSQLSDQISNNPEVVANSSAYVVSGSVVAFICNGASENQVMDGSIINIAASDVTNACGSFVPGYAQMPGFDTLFGGYLTAGGDFCFDVINLTTFPETCV
jgi:hypothetical protein